MELAICHSIMEHFDEHLTSAWSQNGSYQRHSAVSADETLEADDKVDSNNYCENLLLCTTGKSFE